MNQVPPESPELIQSAEALARLARHLSSQARIAVDTESNSLHAYRERVCLLQFSTPHGDFVLDPFRFDELESLAAVFAQPDIEKIFHAAEYDMLCLRRDYAFSFARIFDTMQAGRILGRKQAGLDRLIDEKLGITLTKRFQKADWGQRPLSPELLQYAALDTHYLIPLRDLLEDELREKQLWELAQEDFRIACNGNLPKPRAESPAWARLSARRDLTPRDLAVLRELWSWRESEAARLDRPPFKVLDDERLIELARAKPAAAADLGTMRLSARQLEHWGTALLEAVARGLRSPLLPRVPPPTPSGAYLRRLEHLKKWRKAAAAGMDVESDVVLPRPFLLALADSGPTDVAAILASSPWRLRHFGDQISEVLLKAAV